MKLCKIFIFSPQNMLILLALIAVLFTRTLAQYGNCDYQEYMVPEQQYYVYNQGYPSYYSPTSACRWQAAAPENHVISMSCDIQIPSSSYCETEKISASASGDPNLKDGKNYCGTGPVSLTSFDNKMIIVFSASSVASGGKFICTIVASPRPCDCGWQKTVRIVGGTEAQPNEFPMMAALTDISVPNNPSIFCGCTIIAKQFVVTAAHCVINRNIQNTVVVAGEHDIRTGDDTPATGVRAIDYFVQHEHFDVSTQQNDIALVKVTQDFLYSGLVGPACLPSSYYNSGSTDFTGLAVTAMGWGSLDFGAPTSPVLLKTTLMTQSQDTCRYYYPGKITNTQFCTYGTQTDACQSDSGGPLMWLDPYVGSWKILGLISYGKIGCATNNPGVNTNVAEFIPWITANTPGVIYCVK